MFGILLHFNTCFGKGYTSSDISLHFICRAFLEQVITIAFVWHFGDVFIGLHLGRLYPLHLTSKPNSFKLLYTFYCHSYQVVHHQHRINALSYCFLKRKPRSPLMVLPNTFTSKMRPRTLAGGNIAICHF